MRGYNVGQETARKFHDSASQQAARAAGFNSMMRKATAQSRGANSAERAHMRWIKERGICAACEIESPVICHHMYGATAKVKVDLITVLIGHAAVIGICPACDGVVTRSSRRAFVDAFGPQNELWRKQYQESPVQFPEEVVRGIMSYERSL